MLPRLRHRTVRRRHHQDRAVHLRRARDHVLDVVRVARAIHVRVVTLRRLVLHVRRVDRDTTRLFFRRVVDRLERPNRDLGIPLRKRHRDRRRQRRLPVVHVTDRPHVHVRLRTVELLLGHRCSFLEPLPDPAGAANLETTFAINAPALVGAHDRIRTGDLVLTKDALCRLSYMGFSARPPLLDTCRPVGGAGNGTRTRDPQLGRLMLYQLSYSRPVTPFVPTSRRGGGEGRIRTFEGISRQIYSLLPLATRVPLRASPHHTFIRDRGHSFAPPGRRLHAGPPVELAKGFEPPTDGLQNRCSTPELRQPARQTADVNRGADRFQGLPPRIIKDADLFGPSGVAGRSRRARRRRRPRRSTTRRSPGAAA